MRMTEAAERGDLHRVKVLAGRIHPGRDIQISDVGY